LKADLFETQKETLEILCGGRTIAVERSSLAGTRSTSWWGNSSEVVVVVMTRLSEGLKRRKVRSTIDGRRRVWMKGEGRKEGRRRREKKRRNKLRWMPHPRLNLRLTGMSTKSSVQASLSMPSASNRRRLQERCYLRIAKI
jgi:hypothetical protein